MHRVAAAVAAVVLCAGTLVAAPGAWAARKRPDLVVAAASASSTVLVPGARFQVTDTVKNRGAADAGASVNRYFLSTDTNPGGDSKLGGSRKVKALAPRRASKGTARVTVPTAMAPGNYHLVACADGAKRIAESNERNNCRVADAIEIRAATDHDLIDQALASGEIDEETAITYEVFADFGDPRLPARFSGDDSQVFESDILTTVAQEWSTYSPETQATLAPFLIPPFHHGSWWEAPVSSASRWQANPVDEYEVRCRAAAPDELPNFTEWGFVDAAGGKIRIWWQKDLQTTDEPLALNMAQEIDQHIWPQLITTLGFPQPRGDDGSDLLKACRGGTDAYDISLVDIARSNTYAPTACDNTWAGTLFNRNETPGDIPEVLAHEIFHAIQYSYDVKNGCLTTGGEYGFWKESSAQWIEDALYSDDREHLFADRMLDQPELSLDDPGSYSGEDRFYGEYLFPFFLAGTGRKGTVKQIWDNTTSMGMLEALKAPFGTDFDALWKEFVLHNFNRGDFNYYEDWDGLTKRAKLIEQTVPKGEAQFTVQVDGVAAKYIRFTPDSELTSLKFENNSVDEDGVGIQALIEYADGTWDKEDWSDEAVVDLCLNDPEVTSVTLIFSNSNIATSIPPISAKWTGQKDLCCTGEPVSGGRIEEVLERAVESGCNVSGSVTYTEHYLSSSGLRDEMTTTVKINIQMKPYEDGPGFTDAGSTVAITVSGSRSGQTQGCSFSGTTTGQFTGPIHSEGGALTEVGEYNSDGVKAETRELLVSFNPNDFVVPTTVRSTYSSCENTSHNNSQTIESDEEVDLRSMPGECNPKDAAVGLVRFVGGSPEATTLTTSCSETLPDQGIDRTLTGTISLN